MFGGSWLMSNQGLATVPMNFTLIRGGLPGEDHVYLVDCGFKSALNEEEIYYDYESPEKTLSKVSVTPDRIEVVFITHLHFDHINNMDAFPNAHFFVQREEYDGWSSVMDLPERFNTGEIPWVFSSVGPEDMRAFNEIKDEGRVTFLEGDREVYPGITAHLAKRSHTFGSCWWEISTSNGPFAIMGDAVYWYANMENMWPPGYCQGDAFNLFYLYDRVKQLVNGDLMRVIPGHDAEIYKRHQSWIEGKNPVAEVNLAKGQKSFHLTATNLDARLI